MSFTATPCRKLTLGQPYAFLTLNTVQNILQTEFGLEAPLLLSLQPHECFSCWVFDSTPPPRLLPPPPSPSPSSYLSPSSLFPAIIFDHGRQDEGLFLC